MARKLKTPPSQRIPNRCDPFPPPLEWFDHPDYDDGIKLMVKCLDMGIEYFHVTRPKFRDAILRDGLVSRDGMIFLITSPLLAGSIAQNQIFANPFVVFGVKHGKSWQFESDNVAEGISRWHRIYRCDRIGPDRLIDFGTFELTKPSGLRVMPGPFVRSEDIPSIVEQLENMPPEQRLAFSGHASFRAVQP